MPEAVIDPIGLRSRQDVSRPAPAEPSAPPDFGRPGDNGRVNSRRGG